MQDPATPDVFNAVWKEFKIKSVGYLGSKAELFKTDDETDEDKPKKFNDKTNILDRNLDD